MKAKIFKEFTGNILNLNENLQRSITSYSSLELTDKELHREMKKELKKSIETEYAKKKHLNFYFDLILLLNFYEVFCGDFIGGCLSFMFKHKFERFHKKSYTIITSFGKKFIIKLWIKKDEVCFNVIYDNYKYSFDWWADILNGYKYTNSLKLKFYDTEHSGRYSCWKCYLKFPIRIDYIVGSFHF